MNVLISCLCVPLYGTEQMELESPHLCSDFLAAVWKPIDIKQSVSCHLHLTAKIFSYCPSINKSAVVSFVSQNCQQHDSNVYIFFLPDLSKCFYFSDSLFVINLK